MIHFQQFLKLSVPVFFIITATACSDKGAEYTGILDHRPEGKDGMWVINGTSFSVTDDVELDEDDGAIAAGACVELEMKDGDVTEIESVDMAACQQAKK